MNAIVGVFFSSPAHLLAIRHTDDKISHIELGRDILATGLVHVMKSLALRYRSIDKGLGDALFFRTFTVFLFSWILINTSCVFAGESFVKRSPTTTIFRNLTTSSTADSYLPQGSNVRQREIKVYVSSGELIQLAGPAATMFIADPSIADVQLPVPGKIFIYGKKSGRTTFFALAADGSKVDSFNVVVTYNASDLSRFLKYEIGDIPVSIVESPQGLILSGVVPSADIAQQVKTIAARLAGEGIPVITNLKVSGSMQVSLRVRIAEISRSVIKDLGINWGAVSSSGIFTFGLSGSSPGAGQKTSITALIDALASQGLVSILAEPSLTAVSGEKASFVAGGEFPIPVVQSNSGNISVEYRKFGVSLDFTPTVLTDRLINLSVKPEVSDISAIGAVTLNNIRIPAISTRRAETTVQLGSGESLVIAGLMQNRFNTEIEKLAGLGDIPVVGALFRSTSFQKNESELVIIVTPYIVRPNANPEAFKLPTDAVAPPDDLDRILRGRLARRPTPPETKYEGIEDWASFK
ncbi:MAG: type II and III secretion system protein family protein [Hyphomicrobiales bacterium]|nr:type II and III secretion system protein family protein [Hyphomicrobiales bacterium]